MCFRCNLNGKVEHLKSPYKDHPQSAIYSIKEKTFEVSMTERFHTQKISVIGRDLLYKAHMRQQSR